MDTFFELISGTIIIDKKTLALDLLKKSSDFKYLITKNKEVYRAPELIKDCNNININFDNATEINLKSDYIEYFKKLKEKYKDKLKGRIYIRVTSNCIYTSTLDLNYGVQVY